MPVRPFSGLWGHDANWGETATAADKPRNALHNPVTLPVVCRAHAASQLTWGSGALLERTCLAGRLAGTGAECGFPAAELLPAVSLVVAGRDQGGVPRTRQHRRALRSRGPQPDFRDAAAERGFAQILRQADHASRLHPVQRLPARSLRLPVLPRA